MHKHTLTAWPTCPAQLWIPLACFYLCLYYWVHESFTPFVSLPFMLCYLCSLLQLCTCLRCVTSCLSLLLPPVRCLYVFFLFLVYMIRYLFPCCTKCWTILTALEMCSVQGPNGTSLCYVVISMNWGFIFQVFYAVDYLTIWPLKFCLIILNTFALWN